MPIDIIMPQLGESVVEGTITKWLVKPGDFVQRDQPVVEVATDKADSEVPSPDAGRITRVVVPEGATVKIGAVLCELEAGTQGQASTSAAVGEPAPSKQAPSTDNAQLTASAPTPTVQPQPPEQPQPTSIAVDQIRKGYTGSVPIEHLHSGLRDSQTFAPRHPQRVVESPGEAGRDTTVTWRPPKRDQAKAPTRSAVGSTQASPVVRRLALEHSVDLSALRGSGDRGRITRDDVMRAAGMDPEQEREPGPVVPDPPPGPSAEPLPRRVPTTQSAEATGDRGVVTMGGVDVQELATLVKQTGMMAVPSPGVGYRAYKVPAFVPKEGDQVIPFSRKRRLTADHMVYSKLVSPHVVTVAEIDLHKTMRLREKFKDVYKKDGISLTVLAFVCDAVVRALREFPGVNARVLDDAYVLLRDINLGVAVDVKDGLVVPNIKRADELSVRGLARAIGEVAVRARDGKLGADDFAGTTFSVSNPGIKGNLFGGAIISQPAVGIVRTGEIKKRAVVIEQDGTDVIAIHPVMYAALSYDHRIIDGLLANSFLHRVAEILSEGDFSL